MSRHIASLNTGPGSPQAPGSYAHTTGAPQRSALLSPLLTSPIGRSEWAEFVYQDMSTRREPRRHLVALPREEAFAPSSMVVDGANRVSPASSEESAKGSATSPYYTGNNILAANLPRCCSIVSMKGPPTG